MKYLVTGGAGSIGSEIVKRLVEPYNTVRIFDISENGLFELDKAIGNPASIRLIVGDVRDHEEVKRAMKDIDVVFHCAALKHVPLCEYNPYEAVKTNVMGTQNIISAAEKQKVKKVVCISTDKAVNPINVMGATKLLAERLIANANRSIKNTKFCCVRFGNVTGSRGSLIPIIKWQIANGKPVTITDKKMTRFFMSIDDAVGLVLKASKICKGGEIFILKMEERRVEDVINETISKAGADIYVVETGIREGEKLREELYTNEEKDRLRDIGEMFVIEN